MGRIVEAIAPARMGEPFRWNLAASWVGQVGDGIALAAGPLLVASLTRSPVLIAAAAVVQRLPGLLVGLYAGAVADRADRRRVVVAANLARVLVLGVLVVAVLTGALSTTLLLALLLLVGTAEVFADVGLIKSAGLRLPPLQRALLGVARHPELAGLARLADLPSAPGRTP